jgi:hypothetical protein
MFFLVLAGLVTGYIIMVELVKQWFYRHNVPPAGQKPVGP